MSKTTSIIVAILILTGAFYYANVIRSSTTTNNTTKSESNNQTGENIAIKDGVQYVTISARGGYSPRTSSATAGIPTKLVMKTNGTFDCSLALVIRSLNYRDMLPSTGETIIDAGTPKSGDILQGVCSMGMYSFAVRFN